ncbi:hypothetical protein [Halorarum halobium]|uniref:hypothetical protein n=1 Tax=Halorarum halobium TaxID=3075121 RepID=UPI0028AD9262|nr:hypothetical protein [Halobaculum sp. XH14]
MVPSPSWRRVAVAALAGLAIGLLLGPSVNALPGFSDHTGPSEMRVTSFDRLEAGCAEQVATRAGSAYDAGNYTKTAFVRTGSVDANLSARVVRTSPPGADLSTFRVRVDSHHEGPANATCETGVLYRVTITPGGGSPEGLVPDAHGTRVLWLENGEYAGCSGSVTSPLETGCSRFRPGDGEPRQVWANGSGAAT